jgi:hypothetical protein
MILKRFAWLLAAGVLAVGSIAVAQPDLIVYPWGAAHEETQRRAEFRVTQRSYTFPGTSDVIVDPWRGALPDASRANATLAVRDATARTHAWPRAGEIIDPWASSEGRASPRFDALIVDPWAR